MLKKYKHIAFDLDGTLVHTTSEYRHKIIPIAVNQLGGKILNEHSIDRFWFESGRNKIIRDEFNIDPKLFWDLFRQIDSPENRSLHTYAYSDSGSCFERLRKMGKIISIITGAPHWIASMEIEKLNGAPHDFYFSINQSDFDDKPSPESLYYVLRQLNVKASDTVYIGNSNEDANFAKNADIDFIYLNRSEYRLNLTDYPIATINNLERLF